MIVAKMLSRMAVKRAKAEEDYEPSVHISYYRLYGLTVENSTI